MMRHLPKLVSGIATAFLMITGSSAFAHAKLVTSTPAANASASNVRSITLTFSEPLIAKLSGVEIMIAGGPSPVSGFKTALSADGKLMMISMQRPLATGSYQLKWHAVTSDTHRIQGDYAFSVK
jgi:methionine-rich copper-binding protein CopC